MLGLAWATKLITMRGDTRAGPQLSWLGLVVRLMVRLMVRAHG